MWRPVRVRCRHAAGGMVILEIAGVDDPGRRPTEGLLHAPVVVGYVGVGAVGPPLLKSVQAKLGQSRRRERACQRVTIAPQERRVGKSAVNPADESFAWFISVRFRSGWQGTFEVGRYPLSGN